MLRRILGGLSKGSAVSAPPSASAPRMRSSSSANEFNKTAPMLFVFSRKLCPRAGRFSLDRFAVVKFVSSPGKSFDEIRINRQALIRALCQQLLRLFREHDSHKIISSFRVFNGFLSIGFLFESASAVRAVQ